MDEERFVINVLARWVGLKYTPMNAPQCVSDRIEQEVFAELGGTILTTDMKLEELFGD